MVWEGRRREAPPIPIDGREHDGTLAAEGRQLTTRHIAVYPRILTAANSTSGVLHTAMPRAPALATSMWS